MASKPGPSGSHGKSSHQATTTPAPSEDSEDVLLLVPNVKHRKVEGTLYVMPQRLAWMIEGRDHFDISHWYANIKTQKISPDTKEKVQLQIVPHQGEPSTFHFVHPESRVKQVEQRNAVKELLQQLLPKFRQQISSELEEKKKRLQENPRLFQLYKDLVVSKVLGPDEFWANVAADKYQEKRESQLAAGVSAGFWASVKPQTSGTTNGITYNLTMDVMDSIFKTYPVVKRKHMEYVPHKMSEQEFWTMFFQSHYFHRDRIDVGSSGNTDVFSECARADEQSMEAVRAGGVVDPLMDIERLQDSTLPEGFGSGGSGVREAIHPHNLSMIRRFNFHSTQVLRTSLGKPSKSSPATPSTPGTDSTGSSSGIKRKITDLIEYEDLSDGVGGSSQGQPSTSKLCITDSDKYCQGPSAGDKAASSSSIMSQSKEQQYLTLRLYQMDVEQWDVSQQQQQGVLSSALAVSVIGEVTPGGTLMKSSGQQRISDQVPTPIKVELAQLYTALMELLRHFWTCFPVSSGALEDKVCKMKANLERFSQAKLRPFKERVDKQHVMFNVTHHMDGMIQAAYSKFNKWQHSRSKRVVMNGGQSLKR